MSYGYFIEEAASHRDAEELVLNKYGDKATIIKRRQIQKGGILGFGRKTFVEVSGYIAHEPVRRSFPSMASKQSHASPGSLGHEKAEFNAAKQEILKIAGQNDSIVMNKILAELKDLRGDVRTGRHEESRQTEQSPSLQMVQEILEENEFSKEYREYILKKCRGLSMEQLDDKDIVQQYMLAWIAETISIKEDMPRSHPRVIVLVGPTGVGKTTTIAKLAGLYCSGKLGGKARSVRIIATDHYRIGALKQIEKYAEIMNIPLEEAATVDELKKSIAVCRDADMIFIDTPGHSPNDYENLAKMNAFLQSSGSKMEVFLAISANVKSADTIRIMQQFEPFNYTSVIATKIDEASSLGTIISVLWEKQKNVSFMTCGQKVPWELHPATVGHFLKGLTGFLVRWDETLEEQK